MNIDVKLSFIFQQLNLPFICMQSSSFLVIWYYWYKTYLQINDQPFDFSLKEIAILSQKYHIQCVEPSIICTLKQKSEELKDKKQSIHSKKSQLPVNSPNRQLLSPKNQSAVIYIINPVEECKNLQVVIRRNVPSPQKQQMLGQLFSYYTNQRNGYLVGDQAQILRQILLVKQKQEEELQGRGDSFIESYEKVQNKIDQLQLGNKLGEFDGVQLVNCKYKDIPHTFVRIKKNSYAKCLQLGTKIRMSPCQPKPVGNLPIVPRLSKLRPSPSKIQIFGNYLEELSKHYPTYSPSIDSIYQFNNVPYVFAQQDGGWQCDRLFPIFCYYVGYGNTDGLLGQKRVQKWLKQNRNSTLAKTVDRIRKIRGRHEKLKTKIQEQKLGLIVNLDQQIW